MLSRPLRIGTRSSPMAMAQTHLVRDRLVAAHPALAEPGAVEIAPITTVADKVLDRPLSAIGGKGLFTKELEAALLDGRIDLAVHSMKDVETWLPAGLVLACILPRDDPREAFLSPAASDLDGLPPGARVGTSSLRRSAQVLLRRPDLRIVPLRGNANTRLRKLAEGACDATLLALCGLRRIGLADEARGVIEVDAMLPAPGQGALGIECREADEELIAALQPLACPVSRASLAAERALLAALDGSCRTPVAALAEPGSGRLRLRGLLFMPDGSRSWAADVGGPLADAVPLGREAGERLRREGGATYEALLR